MKTKLMTAFIISLFTLAFLSVAIHQVEATPNPKVHITFTTSGLSNCGGEGLLIIDGQTYLWTASASKQFNWEIGSTHSVQALTSVESYDTPPTVFTFSGWTNGNGLVIASGTFKVPSQAVTVTANYVQSTVTVKFIHDGLSNINNDVTILTIDGVSYHFWDLTMTNPTYDFSWEIGSQHTVIASTPITGWDDMTHSFSSWTNGNGLTGSSGTFTVPSSDVIVTANYALTQSALETALTMGCTLDPVSGGDDTIISGILSSGDSGVAGKTITLTYYDGLNWNPIGSTTTACDGTYTYSWTVPEELENGVYPVKADFLGDSCYLPSSATTGTLGNGGLTVLPESTWGSLVALIACFSGTLVFFKIRTRRS